MRPEFMNKELLRNAVLTNQGEILQPYDALINLDGFDAICALSENLGGFTVYIPSTRTIFAKCLEQAARQEYNGQNLPTLARKYGYTERHMRRIINNP